MTRKITLLLAIFVSFFSAYSQFNESFESGIPGTWSVINGGDANTWTATTPGTGTAHTGTNVARINYSATAHDDYLVSQQFTVTSGVSERLRFWYKHRSNSFPEIFDVKLSTGGNAAVDFTITLASAVTPTTTWQEYEIDLSAYDGQQVYVAFYSSTTDQWELYIDDVIVDAFPSCIAPDTFASSNVTATSVDLSWNDPTASQFDFEYVIQPQGTGMPAGAGTLISAFTVTDGTLSAATAYEAWVRANCGGGDYSAWVGPVNFTTLCVAVAAPFLESFETPVLPACWSQGGATTWEFGSSATTPTGFAAYGAANVPDHSVSGTGTFIGMDGSDNTDGEVSTLTTPLIDVSGLTIPYLSYYVFSNNVDDAAQNELVVEFFDGAAWNTVETIQANLGTDWVMYGADLTTFTITGGVQVRFTVTGVANGGSAFYNDILIDDVSIDEAPACFAPTGLAVSNLTTNTVDITWNDGSGGAQFDFYYVIQPAGTGTAGITVENYYDYSSGVPFTATCTDLTDCANTLLTPNTAYEVFVRDDCGGAWVGPINFSTSIEVICGTPVNTTYCYDDNDTTTWTFTSNDGSPLRITFNAGAIESCCDDILIYDGTDNSGTLLYQGNNGGDLSGLIFDSTSDSIYIEIDSDGSVSCVDTGLSPQWDFTVACATCVNPTATYTIVPDCANSQFSVEVDLTDLGSATSVTISDGTTDFTGISSTGVQTFGPYADGASVTIDVTNEQDNSCTISSGALTYVCPPANDDCANAEVLTPGAVFTDNPVVGTNVGATDSGETAPGCAFYSGGDVWYSVQVPASGSITIETNSNSDVITDSGLAVYSGTCGSLTLIECDDDDSLDGAFSLVALTGRTPGETLYVNVWEYGNNAFGSMQVSAYDASLSASSFDSNSFVAYPNPVKNVLTLEYSNEITNVSVYNMLGQEVLTRTVNAASAQVDMSQLAAGTYLVNVTSGDVQKTIKVVKQ